VGTKGTTGFVRHRVSYGTVWVLPTTGYGVYGYGCGVGKPDLRYTRAEPYLQDV